MIGKEQIVKFIDELKALDVSIAIQDEIIGPNRVAYCLWCTLPDGKRVVENTILHLSENKIGRQVDVSTSP